MLCTKVQAKNQWRTIFVQSMSNIIWSRSSLDKGIINIYMFHNGSVSSLPAAPTIIITRKRCVLFFFFFFGMASKCSVIASPLLLQNWIFTPIFLISCLTPPPLKLQETIFLFFSSTTTLSGEETRARERENRSNLLKNWIFF